MTLDEVESRAEDAGEQYVFDESWDEVQSKVASMKKVLRGLQEEVAYLRESHTELTKKKILELRDNKDDDNNLLAFFLIHGHHMFRAPRRRNKRTQRKPRRGRQNLTAAEILPSDA